MTLQLEAVLSLMRFRDNIMKKLSNKDMNKQITMENTIVLAKEKFINNNNNNSEKSLLIKISRSRFNM